MIKWYYACIFLLPLTVCALQQESIKDQYNKKLYEIVKNNKEEIDKLYNQAKIEMRPFIKVLYSKEQNKAAVVTIIYAMPSNFFLFSSDLLRILFFSTTRPEKMQLSKIWSETLALLGIKLDEVKTYQKDIVIPTGQEGQEFLNKLNNNIVEAGTLINSLLAEEVDLTVLYQKATANQDPTVTFAFQRSGVPKKIIIDPNRIVRFAATSAAEKKKLEEALDSIEAIFKVRLADLWQKIKNQAIDPVGTKVEITVSESVIDALEKNNAIIESIMKKKPLEPVKIPTIEELGKELFELSGQLRRLNTMI